LFVALSLRALYGEEARYAGARLHYWQTTYGVAGYARPTLVVAHFVGTAWRIANVSRLADLLRRDIAHGIVWLALILSVIIVAAGM
jgi:hypothetical protein